MKEMKKIGKTLVVLLITIVFSSSMLVCADTADITGNYTPTSSVSAELWNTTMLWGSLATGATATNRTQINNTGDTNIDVTIKYKDMSADLTLVASPPGADDYRMEQNGTGSWTDITVGYTAVVSDLVASTGTKTFDVRVTMGSSFTQDWGIQYHNNTVQYVAHT